jgi:hypothetical protein
VRRSDAEFLIQTVTSRDRRKALDHLLTGRRLPSDYMIAVALPLVLGERFWWSTASDRAAPPENALSVLKAALGDGWPDREPFFSAIANLRLEIFDQIWKAAWAMRQRSHRLGRLALRLTDESGDTRLWQLVEIAIAIEQSGRIESLGASSEAVLVVEIPATGSSLSNCQQVESPECNTSGSPPVGVPATFQHAHWTDWSGASEEELSERTTRLRQAWRNVWAHLANAIPSALVLTHRPATAEDGAVLIEVAVIRDTVVRWVRGHLLVTDKQDLRRFVKEWTGLLEQQCLKLVSDTRLRIRWRRMPSERESDHVGRRSRSSQAVRHLSAPGPVPGSRLEIVFPHQRVSWRSNLEVPRLPTTKRLLRRTIRAALNGAISEIRAQPEWCIKRPRLDLYSSYLCVFLLRQPHGRIQRQQWHQIVDEVDEAVRATTETPGTRTTFDQVRHFFGSAITLTRTWRRIGPP